VIMAATIKSKLFLHEELEPVIAEFVHDMKTPLVAIKSSLNCTKDIFGELIQTYEIATEAGLVEKKLDLTFLKKISNSFSRSINETLVSNYYLNKLYDSLLTERISVNKMDTVVLSEVISEAIRFHGMRFENCHDKFLIDPALRDVSLYADKAALKKSIMYLFDNLLRIASINHQSSIQVSLFGSQSDGCCFNVSNVNDFSFYDYFLDPIPSKNSYGIGCGMYYFKTVIEKTGWALSFERSASDFSVRICFKSEGCQ